VTMLGAKQRQRLSFTTMVQAHRVVTPINRLLNQKS